MNRFFLPFLTFTILLCPGGVSSADRQLYTAAPTILPNVTREMKTPGFWISRHPSPDDVILTEDEIDEFNARIKEEQQLAKDILALPETITGDEIGAELEKFWSDFKAKDYFAGGEKAPASFYEDMKQQLNLDNLPDEAWIRFGFIVRFSDQRFYPTDQGLYASANDIDFDELQNSTLDIGTPVAIFHESLDGQWVFVKTDITDGWVKAENVASATREEVANFYTMEISQPGVVISAKADIYIDKEMTQVYGHVRMGTVLPVKRISITSFVEYTTWYIILPVRGEDGRAEFKTAFMSSDDILYGRKQRPGGFLPYTARNVITQAFKLLDAPYGWGGMNGEQDCSRFIQEVFGTFGFRLPRNSKEQALVGRPIKRFDPDTPDEDKFKVLRNTGGGAVLPMRGHIMIYLGEANQRPYAIHAIWGYREPGAGGGADAVRLINRVAVTDLFLGEGSQKGSLLNRLSGVVEYR